MLRIRADQAAGKAWRRTAPRGRGAASAHRTPVPDSPSMPASPTRITTEDESAQGGFRKLAARRVDIIKIWVDDREGAREKSLPIKPVEPDHFRRPQGRKSRSTAHIFYHKDAEELAAAGIDAFAHLVRDKVMSDALIATMKEKGIYAMPKSRVSRSRCRNSSPPAWLDEPYLAGIAAGTSRPADAIAHLRGFFSRTRTLRPPKRNRQKIRVPEKPASQSLEGRRCAHHPRQRYRAAGSFSSGSPSSASLQLMAEGRDDAGRRDRRGDEPARPSFLGTMDPRQPRAGQACGPSWCSTPNPLDDIRNTRRIAKMYLSGRGGGPRPHSGNRSRGNAGSR